MTNWTVSKVKEELPNVKVSHNGRTCNGVIVGSELPFVYVIVRGRHYDLSAIFRWTTIAHCLNEDKPLIF